MSSFIINIRTIWNLSSNQINSNLNIDFQIITIKQNPPIVIMIFVSEIFVTKYRPVLIWSKLGDNIIPSLDQTIIAPVMTRQNVVIVILSHMYC